MKDRINGIEYVVKVCDNLHEVEFVFDSAVEAMEFGQVAYVRMIEAERVSYHEPRGVTIAIRDVLTPCVDAVTEEEPTEVEAL